MAELTKDTPYPLPGHMTMTQYANHRKVAKTRISWLIQSGRLNGCWIKGFGGKYNIDPISADAELDKTAHFREHAENKKKGNGRAGRDYTPAFDAEERRKKLSQDDDIDFDMDDDLDEESLETLKEIKGSKKVQNFSKSQVAAAHYKAELARIKFEQLEKILINADEAKEQTYEMARAIRDSLMELPDRLSAEFAALRDERKIAIRLELEIRTALERVTKVIESMEASS
jgi:hypothetical protein